MIDGGGLPPYSSEEEIALQNKMNEEESYYMDTNREGITATFEEDLEDFDDSVYETVNQQQQQEDLVQEILDEEVLGQKRRSYFFMFLLCLVMGVLVLFYCGGFAFCVRNTMGAVQNSSAWCRGRKSSGPRYSLLPNMHKLA